MKKLLTISILFLTSCTSYLVKVQSYDSRFIKKSSISDSSIIEFLHRNELDKSKDTLIGQLKLSIKGNYENHSKALIDLKRKIDSIGGNKIVIKNNMNDNISRIRLDAWIYKGEIKAQKIQTYFKSKVINLGLNSKEPNILLNGKQFEIRNFDEIIINNDELDQVYITIDSTRNYQFSFDKHKSNYYYFYNGGNIKSNINGIVLYSTIFHEVKQITELQYFLLNYNQ